MSTRHGLCQRIQMGAIPALFETGFIGELV